MTQLRAALEKFGDDAVLWEENSQQLSAAQSAASRLAIDSLAFGPAAWLGLADRYHEVQQMIVDRLGEGSEVCSSVAANLISARDSIQRADETSDQAVQGAGSGE